MASLVPSEVSLLQTYSVNKLLENFSYDLIFPMDLPGDPGAAVRSDSDKRGKPPPLRTSFAFEDSPTSPFEDISTPSSVHSDYFSFSSELNQAAAAASGNQQQWFGGSRPNVFQHQPNEGNNNFAETNLPVFSPPKRYLSDSNLSHYLGNAGDTGPAESQCYSQNHAFSSPFKDSNKNVDPLSGLPDYEPYHTRSSFNLNYNPCSSSSSNGNPNHPPVQKVDKSTMYSSDFLNLLALNSSTSSSSDSYHSSIKGLEQTMRLLQGNSHPGRHSSFHGSGPPTRSSSSFCSSSFSRQNSSASEETMDFRQSAGGGLNKFNHHSTTSGSNFSSCSSIDMNGSRSAAVAAASALASAHSVRTWNGVIPARTSKAVTYSQKVFLGGIPWETSEETLKHIFGRFGPLRVEWPGKDPNFSTKPKGCVYIIFENEKQVRDLLAACQLVGRTPEEGKYFYKFPWKNMKTKNVEVIPWNIADSHYVLSSQVLDPTKTIFVGALHGKLTAEGLALIMNDLFGGVVYTGIDMDKFKYPLGAGRVTFNNSQSYMKAIQTGYLLIKTPVFTKKVQIDPYLEDNLCSGCNIHHGPYYCRDLSCFRYFCSHCWKLQHNNDSSRAHHRPLTRNSKSQSIVFHD